MKRFFLLLLIAGQIDVFAQQTTRLETSPNPLILTVRREQGQPTGQKVVFAKLKSCILTQWATTKSSDLKIPMRGPFIEHQEAENLLNQLLAADATPGKNDEWNYLVGRLEGNGVGPNHSFFTLGKSVLIGKADANGTVIITLACDVTGPWMDGEPMTHAIHFIVPRSSLPQGVKKVTVETEITRVGDTSGDDKIIPPKYTSFDVSFE